MAETSEVILVNVSGNDRPGVTASLSQILASYGVNVLDIGQAVIHNTLSLGLLIEVPKSAETSPILKDVLFKAHQLGMQAQFTPITVENYNAWVELHGKDRYYLTVLSRRMPAAHIARVTDVVFRHGLNIDGITRLSGRMPLTEGARVPRACVELSLRGTPLDTAAMKAELMEVSQALEVDIAFQQDNAFRRNRRLVCFDMDSTLIQTEVIVDLARAAGVGEEVHQITEAAMRGELDFSASFQRRIALLKGLPESTLQQIAANLPITEGAERLISTLKRVGYKTAILSGGFTYMGEHLKRVLGVDYVYANELEIRDGVLTGNHVGPIVDGQRKADLLRLIAQHEGIQLDQVIAIGDGANDLPMLNLAGLGIAFHAKRVVKESADHAISTMGLDGVLYLLGLRDREIDRILSATK